MGASSHFGEFELDFDRVELCHKSRHYFLYL